MKPTGVGETCIMTTAKYQQYIRECMRWAAKAQTEEERLTFLEMADAWTRVAFVVSDGFRQSAFDANVAKRAEPAEVHIRAG
jgi:hypothetical protein